MESRKTLTRYYQKQKRSLEDNCNICGINNKLTYDHVPPKCCFNDIHVKPIENMSGEKEKYNPTCSQNGLKYRSICDTCNNGVLAKYDKSIEDVVFEIKSHLNDCDNVSTGSIVLSVKINAFAKSICGHFLAMKNYYDKKCKIDISLREYVLSPSALPPRNYHLLIRYYPFSTVFALRDVAIAAPSNNITIPNGTISVLSSFPIAYILSQGSRKCGFIDLFEYCSNNIDDIAEIPLDINTAFYNNSNVLRDPKWPCNVTDDSFGVPALLCSASAVEDSAFGNRNADAILQKIKTSSRKL